VDLVTEETQSVDKVDDQKDPNKNTNLAIVLLLAVILFLLGFLFKSTNKDTSSDVAGEKTAATSQRDSTPTTTISAEDEEPEDEVEVSFSVNDDEDTEEAVVDDEEEEEEEPEDNTSPDLYIHEYTLDPEPERDEEFTVHIEIKNKGDGDAGEFDWEWYASEGEKECDGTVEDLNVDEKVTVECEYTYDDSFIHQTKVIVDSGNDVVESNELNNQVTDNIIPIYDEPKADLYISEYSFDHYPEKQVLFTVRIGIYNQGDKAAGGFWWEWWPTGYDYACREYIPSLAAHGGRIVYCPYTYGGWAIDYPTKAVADVGNLIDESDETNNERGEPVTPIH